MAKRSVTKRLPSICIDENLSPALGDVFRREGFRVLEVSKHPGLRGRDERDFIDDLRQQNAVFVTGDAEFVGEIIDQRRRHAGIVFVAQASTAEAKEWFCLFAAYGIIGRCDESPRAFTDRIAYVGVDGVRVIYRGEDTLSYSWAALDHRADARPAERIHKPRRRRNGARTA
jgi:predicted nuclease of predicted toxin-antitoxin system